MTAERPLPPAPGEEAPAATKIQVVVHGGRHDILRLLVLEVGARAKALRTACIAGAAAGGIGQAQGESVEGRREIGDRSPPVDETKACGGSGLECGDAYDRTAAAGGPGQARVGEKLVRGINAEVRRDIARVIDRSEERRVG